MKRLIAALSCVFITLILSSCLDEQDTLPANQFVIGIERLALSSNELATIPARNPSLNAIITPLFATEKQLLWTLHPYDSFNPNDPAEVAAINPNTGALVVRTGAVTEPMSVIIRVEAISDPSKYDTCILTVYPDYPMPRQWVFSSDIGLTGDLDIGNGGTILFASGGGTGYQPGDLGAGVYVIDPELPYEFGPTPNGGAQSSSASTFNTGTLAGFLYPAKTQLFSGHYRINGTSMRVMKIAAIFAPFTVIVNYRTNAAAESRNADIRIGDKEGLRIQGPGSLGGNTGVGGLGAQTVWYSYNPDNPERPEFGNDQFVPLVYVEANAGIQLYAVYIFRGEYQLNAAGNLVPKP